MHRKGIHLTEQQTSRYLLACGFADYQLQDALYLMPSKPDPRGRRLYYIDDIESQIRSAGKRIIPVSPYVTVRCHKQHESS